MKNEEILFASLVGSKTASSIPRFQLVQNELRKHVLSDDVRVLPETKPVKIKKPDQVEAYENNWTTESSTPKEKQFFPLSFSLTENGEQFTLPYEPMINISGSNTIVKRRVAKFNPNGNNDFIGDVHERWSQNDYEISITGVLMGSIMTGDVSDCYPISDFNNLVAVLTQPRAIYVYCEPLQLLGISKIVIDSFSFPFTKGENVQAYEIRGYSDNEPQLLIQLNDV